MEGCGSGEQQGRGDGRLKRVRGSENNAKGDISTTEQRVPLAPAYQQGLLFPDIHER